MCYFKTHCSHVTSSYFLIDKRSLQQRIFRYLFWTGYFAVLITTFLPVSGELNRINIGPEAFHIRLDHLLHLLVYFLISMYYFFGMMNGIFLFKNYSLLKFVLLILLLATVTEVAQLWVPERTFNVFDLISNLAGVAGGLVVIIMAQKRKGIMVKRLKNVV
jgi:VanZ family protein